MDESRRIPIGLERAERIKANSEYEEEVQTALLSVDQLSTAGQHRAALLSCGRIMEEAVRKWSGWDGYEAPRHIQHLAVCMAGILAQIHPEIANKFDRTVTPQYEYYVMVIEAEMDNGDKDDLLAVVPLVAYISRSYDCPGTAKASCESVIRHLVAREKALNIDAKDLVFAYQLLAESYVYQGLAPMCDPATDAAIIDRHLQDLNWLSGSATFENLRFPYAVARDHLVNGRKTEAHNLLRRIFTQRGKIAGETHTRLNSFIDSLLKSFCQSLDGPTCRSTLWGRVNDSFINDLLEFCLENEKYVELDTLVQECAYRITETRADTPNGEFWNWQLVNDTQHKLAKHRTPQSSFYWEDSRMYCRTWNSVDMEEAFPADPMPGTPISVTVYRDRVECEDAESAAHLQNSEIIRLLEEKRQQNDWRILTAYGRRNWRDTSKAFASTPGPHKFWIFPEDILENAEYRSATTVYRLQQLKSDQSEWMVVRLVQVVTGNEHFQGPSVLTRDGRGTHRDRGPEPYPRTSSMAYKIEDAGQFNIDISVPYVPWQHFERSAGYRAGLTYGDYISCMTDRLGSSRRWHEYRAKMCTNKTKDDSILPYWRLPVSRQRLMPDNFQTTSQTICSTHYGFFNGIPSGGVMIVTDALVNSVNLVSTRWHDWKRFTLYRSTPQLTPNLMLASGETARCLGYIMGCWANQGNIEHQWVGLRLFVVDAILGEDTPDQAYNFILTEGCLGSANEYNYSNDETMNHWEEMTRREKWDRAYERRLRRSKQYYDNDGVEALRQELEQEETRRLRWDAANLSPPTVSSDASISSLGLPTQPSEPAGSSGRVGTTLNGSDSDSTSSTGQGTNGSAAPVQAPAGPVLPPRGRPESKTTTTVKKIFSRRSVLG
ncbi:hypothetical protein GP486_003183 [Trichoglossum hirsutum]|uniref:Uncharacterized protein n=1 Tax=Trichoglossum hirsutum TaxID=265104 RepID=A0A9P8LDE1_9PEZI|nr:hypothetical protein GP486_003183 [Trichoglossum hirsutum]